MRQLPFRLALATTLAFAAATAMAAAQGPSPAMRARLDGFIKALGSGDPAVFEAYAKEAMTPEAYAKGTPEGRAAFVKEVADEFGAIQMNGAMRNNPDEVTLMISGPKTADEGRITLTVERDPPHRISAIQFTIGGGGNDDDRGSLPPVPVAADMSREALAAALDTYIADLARDERFSGAVAVAKNGEVIYEKAFGMAERRHSVPNRPATRFNLGSINKAFTKVAIGQLVEQGKLTFDATLGSILPDYPNADARPATVRQLLEHSAGLGDFFGDEFTNTPKSRFRSNADYVNFVARQPLTFPPGTNRQYCNACYIVLGGIIEKVSGMRYEDYIAKHVFEPADMTGAGFFASDSLAPDVAMGYTRQGGGDTWRANVHMHGATGSAGGGGYSTVQDLLAFDRAMRAGKLLGDKMTRWYYGLDDGQSIADGTIGIAGGAPGINANLESNATWAVAAAANQDPPAASALSQAIFRSLARGR